MLRLQIWSKIAPSNKNGSEMFTRRCRDAGEIKNQILQSEPTLTACCCVIERFKTIFILFPQLNNMLFRIKSSIFSLETQYFILPNNVRSTPRVLAFYGRRKADSNLCRFSLMVCTLYRISLSVNEENMELILK